MFLWDFIQEYKAINSIWLHSIKIKRDKNIKLFIFSPYLQVPIIMATSLRLVKYPKEELS